MLMRHDNGRVAVAADSTGFATISLSRDICEVGGCATVVCLSSCVGPTAGAMAILHYGVMGDRKVARNCAVVVNGAPKVPEPFQATGLESRLRLLLNGQFSWLANL